MYDSIKLYLGVNYFSDDSSTCTGNVTNFLKSVVNSLLYKNLTFNNFKYNNVEIAKMHNVDFTSKAKAVEFHVQKRI